MSKMSDILSSVSFANDSEDASMDEIASSSVTIKDTSEAEASSSSESVDENDDKWFLGDDDDDDKSELDEPIGKAPSEPTVESEDVEGEKDQRESPEAQDGHPVAPVEDEIIDFEFHGSKGKASKALVESWNKSFTLKHQAMEKERNSYLEEARRVKEEGIAELRKAQDLQARLQAHLKANPQFAENWNHEMKISQEGDRLSQIENALHEMKKERLIAAERANLDAQLADLAGRFPVIDNPIFTQNDVAEQALAHQMAYRAAGKELSLESIYQQIAANKNESIRQARSKRLKRKVLDSKVPSGVATSPRGAIRQQEKSVKGQGKNAINFLTQQLLKGL